MTDHYNRTKKQLAERNKTLQKITRILEKLNVSYFLEGGALLGAIRNKNFIIWDHDVEVGVFSDKISKKKILEILNHSHNQNLKISHVDHNLNNLKINLSEHGHTKFSILGFKRNKDFFERDTYRYPSRFLTHLCIINFLGKKYSIPNQVSDFLEWTYGDWKTEVKSRDIRMYFTPKAINSKMEVRIKKIKPKIISFYNKLKFFLSSNKIFFNFKREKNFQFMINSNKEKKDVLFFEIGSSDGKETIEFLNQNKTFKSIIVEPSKKNIYKIRKNLIKSRINKNRYKILNFAISDKNFKGNFYINKKQPNLNSIYLNNQSKKVTIEYKKLADVLLKFKHDSYLVLKMDIEGAEEMILNKSLQYLKKLNKIAIILELHPLKYRDNKINKVFSKLFKSGYNVKFIESAGEVKPCEFKKNGLIPFTNSNNRGLYKDVSQYFVLQNAFKPNFKLIKFGQGFSSKIIRSIMIEK
jgi:FkbM family methyltransferase